MWANAFWEPRRMVTSHSAISPSKRSLGPPVLCNRPGHIRPCSAGTSRADRQRIRVSDMEDQAAPKMTLLTIYVGKLTIKKPLQLARGLTSCLIMVGRVGVEPTTPGLKVRCLISARFELVQLRKVRKSTRFLFESEYRFFDS